MVSEVLSYLIMITCILIRVSSKEVKWTVRDTPPKLGQDLTLFCKVDNCTVRETKRWHGGPDDKVLMLNSGISTDKTKYSTSIEQNGFILTILNLTVKDVNISYTCSCGLDLDDHILYIEDVYTVDNLNKTTNGTNYIGTIDVGGISLYVYIAIPVAILVILLIIVIVVSKRHWLSRILMGKTNRTGRSKKEEDCNLSAPSADTYYSERVNIPNVTVPLLNSNPLQSSDTEKQVEKVQSGKDKLQEEIDDVKRTSQRTSDLFRLSTQEQQRLHSEKRILDENINKKNSELLKLQAQHTEEVSELKKENKWLSQKVRDLQTEKITMKAKCFEETTKAKNDFNELVEKYRTEMDLRKKCHNELVELKGNIRVFCRVRPKIKEDGDKQMANIVVDYDRDNDGLIYVSNKTHTFEVDKVFKQRSLQKEVFGEVKALVTSCIDGYNVCIFAYGQTGSGKTFTMEGPPENPGINPRALKALLKEASAKGDDWSFTIDVSFIEIYNENIRDLLSDNPSNKMVMKMNPDESFYVSDLSLVVVKKIEDVNKVLDVGKQNRTIGATDMNEHSSRSHALLCVTVKGVNKTTNTKTRGKLNLVDLAGLERVSKTGAVGKRLKEAQNINKSLSFLGDVISDLRSKRNFIPYRNSKLTSLLKDSLGGNSKTLMIVQVAPVVKNVEETICSLNFAQRVRAVELGQASKKISQEM